jgi:toluene monooxygenase system ferredoxin subunit
MARRRVLDADQLWSGEMIGVEVDGVRVLLVNVDHHIYAFEDRCAHQQVRLSEGRLQGTTLTCRAHEWCYDATTGCGLNPDTARLRTWPVEIVDGGVFIDVEKERS